MVSWLLAFGALFGASSSFVVGGVLRWGWQAEAEELKAERGPKWGEELSHFLWPFFRILSPKH
jgi:hypothetical protein